MCWHRFPTSRVLSRWTVSRLLVFYTRTLPTQSNLSQILESTDPPAFPRLQSFHSFAIRTTTLLLDFDIQQLQLSASIGFSIDYITIQMLWLLPTNSHIVSSYLPYYILFSFFFCIQCVCCSSENLAQWVCSQPFFFLFAELTVISAVLGALSRHPKKLQFFKIHGLCSFRFKIWTAITLKFSLS